MRHAYIILAIILMVALTGCAGEGKETKKTSESAKYSGFMDWKAGMWAETVTKTIGMTVTTRTELIENSPSEARFQMITDMDGDKTVSQIWIDRKTGSVTKAVIKTGDQVMCVGAEEFQDSDIPSEGESYPADKTGVASGTYETPTGKTVTVAKFRTSSGEAWVSSQVPFGIVKIVQDGETLLSLKDYGTIGAKSLISEDEIDCDAPVRYTRETEYEPLYETSDESYDSQEHDYEEYYEEESSGADEDVNYEAYTDEKGTGEDVNFNCDDCEGMPAMARSACLASCR